MKKYLTNTKSNVFCLQNLHEEFKAALLARYSRAPYGIKDVLKNEFLDNNKNIKIQKGTNLINRVLNKFGDESVGELATASLCLENISNLATKYIEDLRIGGSFIEQSTRYVIYDQKIDNKYKYIIPPNLLQNMKNNYIETTNLFFNTYSRIIPKLIKYFQTKLPESEFKIEINKNNEIVKLKLKDLKTDQEKKAHKIAYNFTIRSAACDIARCVLPACTEANMGIVGNGRFFTHLITNLKTAKLDELQQIAIQIENELNKIIPTFIKRNKINNYKQDIDSNVCSLLQKYKTISNIYEKTNNDVKLITIKEHYNLILTNIIFPFVNVSINSIFNFIKTISEEQKSEIILTYIGDRQTKRDRVGKAFESGYPLNFEITTDFGAYRDLHRHRQCSHIRQTLNPNIGFKIPEEIYEIKEKQSVLNCFSKSEDLYNNLYNNGYKKEAQYSILFGHNVRFYMNMNFRELEHICELRSVKAGHQTYRKIVQKMANLFKQNYDTSLESILKFVDYNNYTFSRQDQEARTARKSLITKTEDI